jgi:dihydrofolate reductase
MTPPEPRPHPALTLIAAVARNGAIGRDGGLLWHEPADQQRFRALTIGHPVVMGRKTWDSLPPRFRPLPGRRNVVVSRQAGLRLEGAETALSLPAALALLQGTPRAFVIGGGELYAQALPQADRLELTEIDADLPGDVFFPPWPRDAFVQTHLEARHDAQGRGYAFVTWQRRP